MSVRGCYLCHLDVGVLRELGHEEVFIALLGLHLGIELQPGDGRLWTQVPVQRLQRRTFRMRGQIQGGRNHHVK